jgi:putative ABC transport system substrate-binding protein
MRRRDFITLLGGAAPALAWPLAASAQQPKMQRVGVLILGNADAESFGAELREGLRKSGFVEGQTVQYEFRPAGGDIALLPKLAAELVALKVDVIVALYTPCALAVQRATREIPIVVVAGDPVGLGLVASLARPGGNITGISLMAAELHGKCVELFRDALPGIRRVAALGNAPDPFSKPMLEQIRLAGRTSGIEIAPEIMVRAPDGEIDAAFAVMKKDGAEAVVAQASLPARHVVDGALKYGLPVAAVSRSFADVGAMMSYGVDGPDAFRRSAAFVSKVLQGTKPADLPVEQPTKFELVVNLKTAKALGLKIAESFLLRADTVID